MKQAHFQRAVLLFQQDRFAEAIGELHLQLAEEADDPAAHSLLALCLARLEKYGEATEHAQRAIHLAPDFPRGFYVLANIQLERNRDADARAVQHARIAVRHVTGALLMRDGDEADARRLEQVQRVHIGRADDAEDVLDPVGGQGFDEGFAGGHPGHGRTGSCLSLSGL